MNQKMLELCCQTFPTYEDAIQGARVCFGTNGRMHHRISFEEAKVEGSQTFYRWYTVSIHGLSTGYRWIPDHHDDRLLVEERMEEAIGIESLNRTTHAVSSYLQQRTQRTSRYLRQINAREDLSDRKTREVWMDANGYTDAQKIDQDWYAFPPHGVMPVNLSDVYEG